MAEAMNSTEKNRVWVRYNMPNTIQQEHIMDIEDLAKQLETTIKENPMDTVYQGISDQEAEARLKKYGPNALSERKTLPWFVKLLLCMTGLFNYVLFVGSAISFVAYGIQTNHEDKSNMYLGIILILLVIMTGSLSYYISSKSDDLMAQFKNFIPPKAFVYRNGVKRDVDAVNLVPGDIVEVQIGDNIPADIVLLKTSEMKVNNASLTGESEELLRLPDEKQPNIFESPNVAFFGTACTNGNGVGIVFKTGDATIIGQIASLASSAEVRETTLQRDIDLFIKIVGIIAVCMGLFFFIIDYLIGYSF